MQSGSLTGSGSSSRTVHLLDYAAGNVRSLVNAIEKLGWQVEWVKSPEDVQKAEVRGSFHPILWCYADS